MQQWRGCAHPRAREIYRVGVLRSAAAIPAAMARRRRFTVSVTRNFSGGVYRAVRLFTGDVVFDGVGMLQAGELDGKTVLDMTDHPARSLADGQGGTDRRP
jgi:hypothetical protein